MALSTWDSRLRGEAMVSAARAVLARFEVRGRTSADAPRACAPPWLADYRGTRSP
jgi:hypothetical protein